jgi:hypothetical protein
MYVYCIFICYYIVLHAIVYLIYDIHVYMNRNCCPTITCVVCRHTAWYMYIWIAIVALCKLYAKRTCTVIRHTVWSMYICITMDSCATLNCTAYMQVQLSIWCSCIETYALQSTLEHVQLIRNTNITRIIFRSPTNGCNHIF